MMALVAGAESEPFNHSTIQPFNSSTNHAGNVVSGDVVALDARTATISNAMARSRKRAEKGLCTKEESDAFCEKSEAALRSYLDKQVESGAITTAERKALGW